MSGALRMAAAMVREQVEFRELLVRMTMRDLLLRYAGVMLVTTGRSVACKVVHTPSQRLARWLLSTADRMTTAELPLTHELLARMLGVRRATVSVIARDFQRRGLIEYRRGRIEITDRAGLEAAAKADPAVQAALAGKAIKKAVVVPGKLVNLVVG